MSLIAKIGATKDKFLLTVVIHYLKVQLRDATNVQIVVKRGRNFKQKTKTLAYTEGEIHFEETMTMETTMYMKRNKYAAKEMSFRLVSTISNKEVKDRKLTVPINSLAFKGKSIEREEVVFRKGGCLCVSIYLKPAVSVRKLSDSPTKRESASFDVQFFSEFPMKRPMTLDEGGIEISNQNKIEEEIPDPPAIPNKKEIAPKDEKYIKSPRTGEDDEKIVSNSAVVEEKEGSKIEAKRVTVQNTTGTEKSAQSKLEVKDIEKAIEAKPEESRKETMNENKKKEIPIVNEPRDDKKEESPPILTENAKPSVDITTAKETKQTEELDDEKGFSGFSDSSDSEENYIEVSINPRRSRGSLRVDFTDVQPEEDKPFFETLRKNSHQGPPSDMKNTAPNIESKEPLLDKRPEGNSRCSHCSLV